MWRHPAFVGALSIAGVLLMAGRSPQPATGTSSRAAVPPAARLLTFQSRTVHTPSFPTSATVLKLIFGHTALTVTSTPSPLFSVSPSSTQPWYGGFGERPSGKPAAPTVTPTATTPVAAASPVPAVVSTVIGLPPRGEATVPGCAAALAYLRAYAAPGFQLECPANAQGHEATTTCISEHTLCDLGRFIEIADPCPAAYMNEASNSWVLLGLSDAPIDPYGYCR